MVVNPPPPSPIKKRKRQRSSVKSFKPRESLTILVVAVHVYSCRHFTKDVSTTFALSGAGFEPASPHSPATSDQGDCGILPLDQPDGRFRTLPLYTTTHGRNRTGALPRVCSSACCPVTLSWAHLLSGSGVAAHRLRASAMFRFRQPRANGRGTMPSSFHCSPHPRQVAIGPYRS